MSFFDAISVNQLFLEDRVKKITTSLFFLHRLKLDDTNFWDRVKKIHHPSVNWYGFILWYVFDYQNKNGDDTTKL